MSGDAERFLGQVDEATPVLIRGWVLDLHEPEVPPMVQLELDGLAVASQRADQHRPNLAVPGHATTLHGFSFHLAEPLDPETTVDLRLPGRGLLLNWPDPRPYQPADLPGARPAPAPQLPVLSPLQRETMLTLALHDRQVTAAMAGWTVRPPAQSTADGLLLELLMEMATTPGHP